MSKDNDIFEVISEIKNGIEKVSRELIKLSVESDKASEQINIHLKELEKLGWDVEHPNFLEDIGGSIESDISILEEQAEEVMGIVNDIQSRII